MSDHHYVYTSTHLDRDRDEIGMQHDESSVTWPGRRRLAIVFSQKVRPAQRPPDIPIQRIHARLDRLIVPAADLRLA